MPAKAKQGLIPLYNPLSTDFTVTYDINGDGQPEAYTIHAQEIEYFPPVIAQHLTHHLAKEVTSIRGTAGSNWEAELEKATKEIEVSLE